MARNTKTPVMVLQELTVKKGMSPPEYTLLTELTKQGSHENEFHYRVLAAGRQAFGAGGSKQIAKHDSARKLLKILEKDGIYLPSENPMQDSIPGISTKTNSLVKTAVNCINNLLTLCEEKKIPLPVFKEVSAEGPPHCREFTYECQMCSVTTRATASTIKQAKQIAAKEMLERIQDVLPTFKEESIPSEKAITETDSKAIDKFKELSLADPLKLNFSVNVTDYDLVFKKILDEKGLTFENDFKDFFSETPSEEVLLKILDKLDLTYEITELQEENPCIICLMLSTETPFAVMAYGVNLKIAKVNCLQQAFEFMRRLMDD